MSLDRTEHTQLRDAILLSAESVGEVMMSPAMLQDFVDEKLSPEDHDRVALCLVTDVGALRTVTELVAAKEAGESSNARRGIAPYRFAATLLVVIVVGLLASFLPSNPERTFDTKQLREGFPVDMGSEAKQLLPQRNTVTPTESSPNLTFRWRDADRHYILIRLLEAPLTAPQALQEQARRPLSLTAYDQFDEKVADALAAGNRIFVVFDLGRGLSNPSTVGPTETTPWPIPEAPITYQADVRLDALRREFGDLAGWRFAWALVPIGSSSVEIAERPFREFRFSAPLDTPHSGPPQERDALRWIQEDRFDLAAAALNQVPRERLRLFLAAKLLSELRDRDGFEAVIRQLEKLQEP